MKRDHQRPRIEHRSASKPVLFARPSARGWLFFADDDDLPASDFIGRGDLEKIYGEPEAWIAHRLFKRCGYSGMLRGS